MIALICPPQSGTHILRHTLGQDGRWGFDGTTKEQQLNTLRTWHRSKILYGHIFYSGAIAEELEKQNRRVIFQYRDPRDAIVSRWHKNTISWEQAIKQICEIMCAMKPWFDLADIRVRFEDLVRKKGLEPLAKFLGWTIAELLGKLQIGRSPTFRAGRIGDWKNELPMELIPLYSERSQLIRGWEYEK